MVEYENLKKIVIEKERVYGDFGVNLVISSRNELQISKGGKGWARPENLRPITESELKELIGKYEQVDALIEKLTNETHIVY